MKTTDSRAGRLLAAGALVAIVLLVSACDLVVGPPVHDVGYEHNVGPATEPATYGHEPASDPGRESGR